MKNKSATSQGVNKSATPQSEDKSAMSQDQDNSATIHEEEKYSQSEDEENTETLQGVNVSSKGHANIKSLKLAIVGAPNVGKSTFFNRLIGGRRSIVEDVEGVTRDRIYADVNLGRWSDEIDSLPATIIDTGGLFFEDDTLYKGVQRQAQEALIEADAVIFMVDGRIGLTSRDRMIAKLLRDYKKPIFLLVNKLDSESQETLASDFYSLGLGEPISFSSLGRTFKHSFEKLMQGILKSDVAKELLCRRYDKPEEAPIKIVMMGKPNVGKSSLLNKLVGYERALVHDQPGTTRDALDTELEYKGQKIMLIDTAGLRRKSKVFEDLERFSVDRSIKGLVRAEIAVLVIDAQEGVTHQEQRLASLIQKRNKACVIVINKWDTIEKDDDTFKEYTEKVRYELGFIAYAPLVLTSALTGQRVEKILDECLTVYENFNKRVQTRVFNTVLREIVSINDPAKAGAKSLKIYYGTQVDTQPPTFALFVNEPKQFSENYLRFLEKSIRKEFGFEGVPFKWSIKKSTGKLNVDEDGVKKRRPKPKTYKSKEKVQPYYKTKREESKKKEK